jgi:hypothetical protein
VRDAGKRRKEVRTAALAGWTLPCARPLDAAPRGRAAKPRSLAVWCRCAQMQMTEKRVYSYQRETQAASGRNIYTLLHCYPL